MPLLLPTLSFSLLLSMSRLTFRLSCRICSDSPLSSARSTGCSKICRAVLLSPGCSRSVASSTRSRCRARLQGSRSWGLRPSWGGRTTSTVSLHRPPWPSYRGQPDRCKPSQRAPTRWHRSKKASSL